MKFIPLTIHTIDSNDVKEVENVLRSNRLTQGGKNSDFERALCRYTSAKYAVCVSSGTAALHIACLAAGIKPGDEVIVPSITFVASANCVLYCGAKPVFADIDKDTANIDIDEVKKLINKKTRAIIPVDFTGQSADLKDIHDIAKKNNLIVIEDAAHALGASYYGKRVGSCRYSDMTAFSFHPTKSITTGEGGAVLTNDKKLYEKLLLLRSHGITRDQRFLKKNPGPWYYEMQVLGFNYRMTDLQAALGISQLKKIDRFIAKRREITKKYDAAFNHIDWIKPLKIKPNRKTSCHLYVVLIDFKKIKKTRRQFMQSLKQNGIETQVHYIPVYHHPYYKKIMKVSCKNAEKYYEKALSLPIYPKMSRLEQYYTIKKILSLGE